MLVGWLLASRPAVNGRQSAAHLRDGHVAGLLESTRTRGTIAMIGKALISACVLTVGMAAPVTFPHNDPRDSAPAPATAAHESGQASSPNVAQPAAPKQRQAASVADHDQVQAPGWSAHGRTEPPPTDYQADHRAADAPQGRRAGDAPTVTDSTTADDSNPWITSPMAQDRLANVVRGRERGTTHFPVCPESLVRSTSRGLCRAAGSDRQ